jgi:hypothetical protein
MSSSDRFYLNQNESIQIAVNHKPMFRKVNHIIVLRGTTNITVKGIYDYMCINIAVVRHAVYGVNTSNNLKVQILKKPCLITYVGVVSVSYIDICQTPDTHIRRVIH